MDQPARIVVRSVNWLGDAIMSTPALMALRRGFPSSDITILTPAKLKDLWAHHPAINHVLPFEPNDGPWSVGQRLFKRFDLALILPNSFRSAFEALVGRIPFRVGYEGQFRTRLLTAPIARPLEMREMQKLAREEAVALNDGRVEPRSPYTRESHHVRSYLHLVGQLGVQAPLSAPCLHVTHEERAAFAEKFKVEREGRLILGLNAGAEYGPAKRWPADRFIEAMVQLSNALECDWLVFGARADMGMVDAIVASAQKDIRGKSRIYKLAGRTNLRELCVGLNLCRVLLTNDTGPMHVAAAVGTRVVVPFGSTSPELTGPDPLASGEHRILKSGVPCSPCFLRECPIDFRCMLGISVHQVVDAMIEAARAPEPSCIPSRS